MSLDIINDLFFSLFFDSFLDFIDNSASNIRASDSQVVRGKDHIAESLNFSGVGDFFIA